MKIAFIFSGQGAQYVGMGKELYDAYPVCKNVFDRANEVLGFDIKNLIFNGEKEELNITEYSTCNFNYINCNLKHFKRKGNYS